MTALDGCFNNAKKKAMTALDGCFSTSGLSAESGIRRHVPLPFGICVLYQRNEKATTKVSEDEIK